VHRVQYKAISATAARLLFDCWH